MEAPPPPPPAIKLGPLRKDYRESNNEGAGITWCSSSEVRITPLNLNVTKNRWTLPLHREPYHRKLHKKLMKAELDPKRCFRRAPCRRLRSLQGTGRTALRPARGQLRSKSSPRTSLGAQATFKFVSLKSLMKVKFSVQVGERGGQTEEELSVPVHSQICRENENCCCWNLRYY